ncbi:hypothetical protein G5714_004468 [Onychostoma macrolepis]|uniref:Uncharacterized protein n=1 Tax=Onychostoma macrolepis TaxID=369639 RepID=A0A7J6D5A4_9TELE|nr:hypothetical protein G5714_004468 [Onychostoma macrolepis]
MSFLAPTLVNFVERLVTSTPTPCTPATTTTIATSSKQSIITGVPKEDTLKAEVLWCLNMMESHYSFNSSEGTGALFSAMFPDSAIAKTFACGATKSIPVQADEAHFDPYTDRVDTFLHDRMSTQKPYEKLWRLCRQLLLLSHGQASVERGFSINRQIEDDNLSEDSYVAQRCILDHLRAVGGTKNVTIDKPLLMSVGGARQRYITHLEDMRRKRDDKEKNTKRKYVLDEIEELKMKKKRLKDDTDALETSADKLAFEAEKTGKLTLIAKSNSLRKGAKEKKAESGKIAR